MSSSKTSPTRPSLRRNLGWATIGNGTYSVLQWATIILIARIGTPESVGVFSLGIALSAPFFMLLTVPLGQLQATEPLESRTYNSYLGLSIVGSFICITAISAFSLSLYNSDVAVIIILCAVAKSFEGLSETIHSLLRKHENISTTSKSLIVRGIASLVGTATGFLVSQSVLLAVMGFAFARAITYRFFDVPAARLIAHAQNVPLLRPSFDLRSLSSIARLGAPLGITYLLISLQVNIPRYFIERLLGVSDLGIFAAIAYFMLIGQMFIASLLQTVGPRLAKTYQDRNEDQFISLSKKILLFCFAISLIGPLAAYAWGNFILLHIYGAAYQDYGRLLFWLLCASGIAHISLVLQQILIGMRRLASPMTTLIASTLILIPTSFYFIDRFGLIGVPFALVISSGIQLTGNLISIIVGMHHTEWARREDDDRLVVSVE